MGKIHTITCLWLLEIENVLLYLTSLNRCYNKFSCFNQLSLFILKSPIPCQEIAIKFVLSAYNVVYESFNLKADDPISKFEMIFVAGLTLPKLTLQMFSSPIKMIQIYFHS